MAKWYISQGNNSDVVISSRIRLARNLEDAPFPTRMNSEIKKSVIKKIFAVIKNSKMAGEFNLVDMDSLTDAQVLSLVEKQLITRRFYDNCKNSALLLSNDESVSIMLCEDDHIRLQVMQSGQDLQTAYAKADKIDDIFAAHLHIAYDENLGFLTSCPTDLGTGMKASVLLHLPALAAKGQLAKLSAMVNKLGLSLKPAYSDKGAFFYLSNQVTLGITEQNAIENLNAICDQIVKQERSAREELKGFDEFEDRIFRALGTLKMARKLSADEFFTMISLVRLGVSLGYFVIPYEVISSLIIGVQRGNLTMRANANLGREERDKLRAGITREELNKY